MVNNIVKKRKKIISSSPSDRIFDITNICIMAVLLIIYIWPLWFVVIASFSNPNKILMGEVILWPVDITLKGYEELINYKPLWIGYRNTIIYTLAGTLLIMDMHTK